MKSCSIIGISDKREQWFTPEVERVIRAGRVFSGGKRHHEIMQTFLPEEAIWIDITVPLALVFQQYTCYDEIVIFASGDPLFYGFASTVQRELPTCHVTVYPSFNSLQLLAHRLLLPYQDMHVVSLTGRPWSGLDEALIMGYPLIGVLTDRHKTPVAIWQRMLDYGYDNYTMKIGENLGNDKKERITHIIPQAVDVASRCTSDTFQEQDALNRTYDVPNCVILQRKTVRPRPFGIPEQAFALLDGRAKMITKMPIRLLTLSLLDLRDRHTFWDVGFCTGSVSIEAKLQFPWLDVQAFEVRKEGEGLMRENARRFGTPGIEVHIGDFLTADLSELPRPDAVFIGGHGGKLIEMIERLKEIMQPGCILVFNSVSEGSRQLFREGLEKTGLPLVQEVRMALDDHNPITLMKTILQ